MPSDVAISAIEEERGLEIGEGFQLSPTGCTVVGAPTLEQYGEAIERCARLGNATMWALGDLVVYGEGRADYGEQYTQFIEMTQRSYWTLIAVARVSREFPPGHREFADRISWSHHREVLSLPPRRRRSALRMAADYDWSADNLRDHVRTVRDSLPETPEGTPTSADRGEPEVSVAEASGAVTVEVLCRTPAAVDRLERWTVNASRANDYTTRRVVSE
jgi:hypothetical protein